jgi:RNA polymerase sigma-70 factor, ECF subfamily
VAVEGITVGGHAPQEVTQLLRAWSAGDKQALDLLVPLVWEELHRLAHRYLKRERSGHTLQTTELVNEAYLRLVDATQVAWQDRAHFFAIAANVMRRILVDFARSRLEQKHGGHIVKVGLIEEHLPTPSPEVDVLALDEALTSLAAFDPRAARIVELRFFGGLNVEETGEAIGVSTRTVKRDWAAAKVWLLGEMTR